MFSNEKTYMCSNSSTASRIRPTSSVLSARPLDRVFVRFTLRARFERGIVRFRLSRGDRTRCWPPVFALPIALLGPPVPAHPGHDSSPTAEATRLLSNRDADNPAFCTQHSWVPGERPEAFAFAYTGTTSHVSLCTLWRLRSDLTF